MSSPTDIVLADAIGSSGTAKTFDIDALRPSRFAEGKPNPISELL